MVKLNEVLDIKYAKEDRKMVGVWLPLDILSWYNENKVNKGKVLIKFAEEQIVLQKKEKTE